MQGIPKTLEIRMDEINSKEITIGEKIYELRNLTQMLTLQMIADYLGVNLAWASLRLKEQRQINEQLAR